MTYRLSLAAFCLGALVIAWTGLSFMGTNLLAFTVTLIIAAVYSSGFAELVRYQKATNTLTHSLNGVNDTVNDLDAWLAPLHTSLTTSVRLRIQGEHMPLPQPVMTPYLIGLLVMLGMLGTFVGMVDTLKGAVTALEGSTDLNAIRTGLAAPIKGLGMAFGTSVAGVAASALLGFISTISRRERMLASRLLDQKTQTVFHPYSLGYNRQQAFKAMQDQANTLPAIATRLEQLSSRLETMGEQMGQQLVANQAQFHDNAKNHYEELARSVGQSLQENLAQSGKLVGENLQPIVSQMMQDINASTSAAQTSIAAALQQQFSALANEFNQTSAAVSSAWQTGISSHQQASATAISAMSDTAHQQLQTLTQQQESSLNAMADRFSNTATRMMEQWHAASIENQQVQQNVLDAMTHSAADITSTHQQSAAQMSDNTARLLATSEQMIAARTQQEAHWLDSFNTRMETLTAIISGKLDKLHDAEAQRTEASIQELAKLQQVAREQLATLGAALEEPMSNLIQIASETPKAAAEVIEKLRTEISNNIARDNTLLEERERIMTDLQALNTTMAASSLQQKDAIEKMVNAANESLLATSNHFGENINTQLEKMSTALDYFTGSAVELSSLGEAFSLAVELFSTSNTQIQESLTQTQAALQNANTRSDEQLTYYVAQAREIIDHSLLSQQEIIQQIRQLNRAPANSGENA